jgi:hypothetical protein
VSILIKSLLALSLIPLLAIAVTPSNPTALCDRFVADKDQKLCEDRVAKDKVDWYAATACGLAQDDGQFWKCWDQIKGASFNPAALEKCADDNAMKDAERVSCIDKARLGRTPASSSEFQPLKIGK